jgi:hypothetical protein
MGERDSHSILPPGIEGHFKHFTSGGEHEEWMPSKERKYYTNAFIVQDGKVHPFFLSYHQAYNTVLPLRSFLDIKKEGSVNISARFLDVQSAKA